MDKISGESAAAGVEEGRKRQRGGNYSSTEREVLFELVSKYSDVIENKKTDAVTSRQKNEAWKKVEMEYNPLAYTARTWEQLKQAYENWKRKAKKAAADDKVQRLKTGGGTFIPQIDKMAEQLLASLGNRAKPLTNPFDGDAEYNNESGDVRSGFVHSETGDTSFMVGYTTEIPLSVSTQSTVSTFIDFTVPEMSGHSGVLAAGPTTSAAADGQTSDPPIATASCSKGFVSRQWGGRKRIRSKGIGEERATAAASIATLAGTKRAFYEEKLKMDREHHCLRMQVLQLKKQLYTEKVAKLGEE